MKNELLLQSDEKPCDDCISRQAALELMGNYDLSMGEVVKAIHALPPVTPKEKTGKWIPLFDNDGTPTFEETYGRVHKCSSCGFTSYGENFCGNCGLKMEVKK